MKKAICLIICCLCQINMAQTYPIFKDKMSLDILSKTIKQNGYSYPHLLNIEKLEKLESFNIVQQSDTMIILKGRGVEIRGGIVALGSLEECHERFIHPLNFPSHPDALLQKNFVINKIGDVYYNWEPNKISFCRGNILVSIKSYKQANSSNEFLYKLAREMDKKICEINDIPYDHDLAEVGVDSGRQNKDKRKVEPIDRKSPSFPQDDETDKTSEGGKNDLNNAPATVEDSDSFVYLKYLILVMILSIGLFLALRRKR